MTEQMHNNMETESSFPLLGRGAGGGVTHPSVLIVEDESLAAAALQALLAQADPTLRVAGTVQSIDETVDWLGSNPTPDLVFMDIHLADGLSFAIFDEIELRCPVIFTTAYDQYAIRAFEVNSIGYLLKPISRQALEKALDKFRRQSGHTPTQITPLLLQTIRQALQPSPVYKRNFLVSERDKMIPLPTSSIACLFTELKMVKALTVEGRQHVIDQTMEQLETQLDPNEFFRVNRQYIVRHSEVKEVSMWFNGKLSVTLSVKTPERIEVSRARVSDFKQWLTLH